MLQTINTLRKWEAQDKWEASGENAKPEKILGATIKTEKVEKVEKARKAENIKNYIYNLYL